MKSKKIILTLFLLIITLTINTKASNDIYSINTDIYLDEYGNANVTEIWHVKGSDGTEWYKPFRDLGNSNISNFTVSMDGNPLKYKSWNVHESLSEKRGYYGINYAGNQIELCFGKYDFNEHTFILKYNISNYIFNTSDSQVLYATLVNRFENVNFYNMSVNIKGFYSFPDTLDVWGYGYKGYAYVKNGTISLSNSEDSNMNNNYMVVLAKFPPNTFKTNNTSRFETFNDALTAANEGTFKYDYNNYNDYNDYNNLDNSNFDYHDIFPIALFIIGTTSTMITTVALHSLSSGYGYKGNKKINKKETPAFRDIPCNKDIYYANALIYLNNFNYKETNILGAIILKWIKEKKVGFIKKETGIFKKEADCLDLNNTPTFDNELEQKLFTLMKKASRDDGILEPKEFERWARSHYSSFFDVFEKFQKVKVNELKTQRHIYPRTDKAECKKKNVMDDTIYEESKKLLGLKIFLEEFSDMKNKETLEVHIWDEYLMFAYLFGIADKVAKQLKKLYPEIMEQQDIDYGTIMLINSFSNSTVRAASSARSAAESYSSGGGGFSSGGGGGGSFGGGGFSGGGSR